MKKVVVFSGAGISAESGIKTFRDSDGLWEQYNIADVATPEAWRKDQELVLEFYNLRRKQVINAAPNKAHQELVKLEKRFDVQIITQNIDDLHERAGSKNVLHLHGEIRKSRSSLDPSLVYPIEGWELKKGQKCERGSQLRPFVVWFGEEVPMMENAYSIVSKADYLLVVGTSLNVYPAAGLVNFAPAECRIFLVDPKAKELPASFNCEVYAEPATTGVEKVVEKLLKETDS